MATRRRGRGARIAEALGEGMSNVSSMMMKSMMQDRIDRRQHTNNLAVLDRQGENATTQLLNQALQGLAKGDNTPEQILALFDQAGREAPGALTQIQPTTRRRLETSVGKSIMDAKEPEDVPGDLDIAAIAESMGVGPRFPGLDPAFTEGMAPASGALADLDPAVVDYSQRATARRDTLARKPTDIIEGVDPVTNAPTKQAVNIRDLTTPMITGPSPYQKGVNEGVQETAKIYTAGSTIANQKGAEAEASSRGSETGKMDPALVDARVDEAARTAAARARSEMPYTIAIAKQRAQIEANASANAEHIKNTAAAASATAKLEPFIKRFGELIDSINVNEGMAARMVGGTRQVMSWLGKDTEVAEFNQLVNQNLRGVVQAMGMREAVISDADMEIAQKGLGISALSTRTEAINAYRNLIDMTTIAPIVAARTQASTPMAERMKLAQDLIDSRRGAEAEALEAAQRDNKPGTIYYLDPVTGSTLRLMR